MKTEIKRTSFDLSNEVVQQADTITQELKHASRKDTMTWCINVASEMVEALKRGFQLVLVDKEGVQQPFDIGGAKVEPRQAKRLILAQISKEDVVRLLEINQWPNNHPAAALTLSLVMAAVNPKGPQYVEADLFFYLIYWALRLEDIKFRELIRDVITGCVTSYKSFTDLINAEHYKPHFDSNFVEQQFLADEFMSEKRKQLLHSD
jgi:hypothetical protein